MNTTPLIAHLQANTTGLRFIGGALDLNESTLLAVPYPAAFVLPLGESASHGIMASNTLQEVTQQWGVLLAIKSVRTSATSDQSAELQTLRESVRAALLGWQPNGDTGPMQFSSGDLLGIDAGVILWQDTYTSSAYIQSA